MKYHSRIASIGFPVKLFFSYFIFAIALTLAMTAVHVHFSEKQQQERFKQQARELLLGKISLIKEYVSQGSPMERIPWLMEHLHTSEAFHAWCLDLEGKYLAVSDGGWVWKEEGLPEDIWQTAQKLIAQMDLERGFILSMDSRILLLPIPALETPQGQPFMLYTTRSETPSSMQDNITMTLIMGILMVVLAVPFAYVVSRPLKQAHLALDRRSRDLQQQIEVAAEELAKKDRMLSNQSKLAAIGEMIGNISHQWRLPLTRVQLVLQNLRLFAKNGTLDELVLNRSVIQAKEQIEFMSETIDTFQDFYRIDGKGEAFMLQECILNVKKIIGPLLEHKGITMECDDIPEVRIPGSKQELGQVLLNIIGNAKYALESNAVSSPAIQVVCVLEDASLLLRIKDNAGGIPPQHLPHIFEAHFTTKEKEGTGLGLYMSQTIIQEHFGGTLKAYNADGGACFEICLNRG